jgi:hypothetical protein
MNHVSHASDATRTRIRSLSPAPTRPTPPPGWVVAAPGRGRAPGPRSWSRPSSTGGWQGRGPGPPGGQSPPVGRRCGHCVRLGRSSCKAPFTHLKRESSAGVGPVLLRPPSPATSTPSWMPVRPCMVWPLSLPPGPGRAHHPRAGFQFVLKSDPEPPA